jgi:hypothetical protein
MADNHDGSLLKPVVLPVMNVCCVCDWLPELRELVLIPLKLKVLKSKNAEVE